MNSNKVIRQIYNNIINDYKLIILSEMTNNTDSYYTNYVCYLISTLSRAATASWVALRTSSPFTIKIWSPCISLPSASAMPPLTISDTNTPVSFLQATVDFSVKTGSQLQGNAYLIKATVLFIFKIL